MPETLIQLLKAHRKKQLEMKMFLGPEYKDNDLVCCKPNGEPYNPATFSHMFKDFIRKNNLPDIRFHDLRHTFATPLIGNNVPIKVTSSLLGHSSISTTLDLYSHVMTEMKKEAANKIQEILFGKNS